MGTPAPAAQSATAPVAPVAPIAASDLTRTLSDLIRSPPFMAVDVEKIHEYLRIRKNDFYYRGVQNIAYTRTHSGGMDWVEVPGRSTLAPTTKGRSHQRYYDYSSPIYQGDIRKLVAVLGGRHPNVSAQPLIKDREDYADDARQAEQVASYLYDILGIAAKHRYLILSLAKNGVTYAYTPIVADRQKYGTTEEPVYQEAEHKLGLDSAACPLCDQRSPIEPGREMRCEFCDAPLDPATVEAAPSVTTLEQAGTEQYVNANPELHLYSGAYVTTPYNIRDLTEAPFLRLEYEMDPGLAISKFPGMRQKLSGSLAGPSYAGSSLHSHTGSDVRRTMGSATGVYYRYDRPQVIYSAYWIRPWMYEMVEPGLDHSPIREYLKTAFPNGAKFQFLNDQLAVDEQDMPIIEAESIDEVWVACQSDTGEFLHTPPWMESGVQLQDVWNDVVNILILLLERSSPLTFADPRVLDFDAMRDKGRNPGELIPLRKNAMTGGKIGDSFYSTRLAEIDPQSFALGQGLIEVYREIYGVLPPIFGAAGEDEKTARQAELRRAQALMMLGTLWNMVREFWSAALENSTRQVAKYAVDGRIWVPARGLAQPVPIELGDISRLREGTWTFQSDEQMPMSPGQRQDKALRLLEMASQSPVLAELLEASHPANTAIMQDTVAALPGWKITKLEARKALMKILNQLAQQAPVPGPPPDPLTGEPVGPPEVPSIQPDDVMFDPLFAFLTVREWLVSETGSQTQESNPDGFRNVLLYAQGYKMILEPPMPPPDGAAGASSPAAPGPDVAQGTDTPLGQQQMVEMPPDAQAPAPEETEVIIQ